MAHSYAVGANRQLANEMARIGKDEWEVTALAPSHFHGGAKGLGPILFEPLTTEAATVLPVNAYMTRAVHVFVYGAELRSILARDWHVVHCWEEPYIFAGGQVALWTNANARLVFRSAQNIGKKYPPPFRWIERFAMAKAAGWICSGKLVETNLRRRPGYAELPMRRIPLGVDVDQFQPNRQARDRTLDSLGWNKSGPPVIGYLGRFLPEKGLEMMMRALDALTAPWRALFVGAGPLEPALRSWAERHGDRVRLCTTVGHGEVPPYLNAMDMLCAPSQTTGSWREQFGRMLIEAFASGVPVIGSDSGEIPSVVEGVGVVVGERDEAGWTRVIGDLLHSPRTRNELACAGLATAHQKYAWPVVAAQYLEFFSTLG
jgi:phosphatidylinositol alpha-1,6-mannosyltransferase